MDVRIQASETFTDHSKNLTDHVYRAEKQPACMSLRNTRERPVGTAELKGVGSGEADR